MAISSIITAITAPIIKPAATYLAAALVPPQWKALFRTWSLSAFMVGAEGRGSIGRGGVNIGLVGGVELLVSPWTGQVGLYGFLGGSLGAGGATTGASATLKIGAVYGAKTTRDYTRLFHSITIPIKSLPDDIRKKMIATISRYAAHSAFEDFGQASSAFKDIIRRYPEMKSSTWRPRVAEIINNIDNLSVTIFDDPGDIFPFGFSVNYDVVSKGSAGVFQYSVTNYWWIPVLEEGNFI